MLYVAFPLILLIDPEVCMAEPNAGRYDHLGFHMSFTMA